MDMQRALRLLRVFYLAREVDRVEDECVRQGRAAFHVSGAGHESLAAVAEELLPQDFLHLHYRDKALLLGRGLPVREFFLSLLGRKESHSAGRQMSAHYCWRNLNVLSMVGPVGNNALQAVGVAAAVKDDPQKPIVFCTIGDGTTQEGEFLEAITEAARHPVPVVLVVEDNGWSISTATTGKLFYSSLEDESRFCGIDFQRFDAHDPHMVADRFAGVIGRVRETRLPAIVVCRCARLCDHTNSDEQTKYRDAAELRALADRCDPVRVLEASLENRGIQCRELARLKEECTAVVAEAAAAAFRCPEPEPFFGSKCALPPTRFGDAVTSELADGPRLTMREAINEVLRFRLTHDDRTVLLGEDIEDPKGDVFGVTRGLSTEFPGRVSNSALSEATILGVSIGRALAGQRPVAFIQFADFLPLAFNQIATELGSMYWRTCGAWQCPVIVMIACGGYRPGLGPFHSQTQESLGVHVPGLDVVMPSTSADAAGLLNAALENGRPTLFFYPKALLNSSDHATALRPQSHYVPLGQASFLCHGDELTLVSWGAALHECEKAVDVLTKHGISVDLIDLRSLSPWDHESVCASAARTGRLLVVHEDNITCGFGAEVVATVGELVDRPVKVSRIARADTYIPFHFPSQMEILPSWKRVLNAAASMLGWELTWTMGSEADAAFCEVSALGSGPADDVVEVVALRVGIGDEVVVGQLLAEVEAAKSVVEIVAGVAGVVSDIGVREGEHVRVGQSLLRIRRSGNLASQAAHDVNRKELTIPVLRRSRRELSSRTTTAEAGSRHPEPIVLARESNGVRNGELIYLSRPSVVFGGRLVTTEEIAGNGDGWSAAEAVSLTGVSSRYWAKADETVISLANLAVQRMLECHPAFPPIACIICSSTSPCQATPSISCLVAGGIGRPAALADDFHAFDINAACSGYLYALRSAADFLAQHPDSAVLVVTAEMLSTGADPHDFNTVFLFGDAATATLVTARPFLSDQLAVTRPLVKAKSDTKLSLYSPNVGTGSYLRMDGIAVAREANKSMADILTAAALREGLGPADLSFVAPHPGSIRILQSVGRRLAVDESRILSTLADTGNTSSSSIPIVLDCFWSKLAPNAPVGLVAFGAGYTSAAAIAHRLCS